MRVLFVVGGFSGPSRQPWLMDDLAAALVDAGHDVDVVVGDPKSARPRGEQQTDDPRLTIFSVGTTRQRRGAIARLLGHLDVGFGLHTTAYDWAKRRRYDLCLFTSPASFSWGFPSRLRRAGVTRRNLLFLWDFFPIHQLEIGRINLPMFAGAMKFIERRAVNSADVVALMSPANTRFFSEYHQGASNQTVVIPPWSSPKPEAPARVKTSTLTVVYGGQIAKGRGVDTLIDSAVLLQRTNTPVKILVAGDGPEKPSLKAKANDLGLKNLSFLGALPREEYRELAASAHVGVAITVAGVTPPSFPSKIVEYCSLGVPVIVCVEESSDADDFIERHGAGVSAKVGDPESLATAIRELAADLGTGRIEAMASAARRAFDLELSAERVVDVLTSIANSDSR